MLVEVVGHEHLRPADFPAQGLTRVLVGLLVDRLQAANALITVQATRRRGIRAGEKNAEVVYEAVESQPNWKASATDGNELQDARVVELVHYAERIENAGPQRVVGLDATNVARRGEVEHVDQFGELREKAGPRRVERRYLAGVIGGAKDLLKQVISGGGKHGANVFVQRVLILLEHPRNAVLDRPREVIKAEGTRGVLEDILDNDRALIELDGGRRKYLLQELGVAPSWDQALVVE
mmetsp:Transcript_14967/g.40184  ORF Transcript_14967/g.40184 Transcript_14967/m.40184 type:complete len:237 (-) Transcript_14967:428-1138(-)